MFITLILFTIHARAEESKIIAEFFSGACLNEKIDSKQEFEGFFMSYDGQFKSISNNQTAPFYAAIIPDEKIFGSFYLTKNYKCCITYYDRLTRKQVENVWFYSGLSNTERKGVVGNGSTIRSLIFRPKNSRVISHALQRDGEQIVNNFCHTEVPSADSIYQQQISIDEIMDKYTDQLNKLSRARFAKVNEDMVLEGAYKTGKTITILMSTSSKLKSGVESRQNDLIEKFKQSMCFPEDYKAILMAGFDIQLKLIDKNKTPYHKATLTPENCGF